MAYELYYWTGIQGRGEFVRLALEDAGAEYRDVAREKGDGCILSFGEYADTPSFAPPFLKDGKIVVGQTAAILFYLGERLGLAPSDERLKLWTHQIQLTITDLVAEAHDVHHPIGVGRYYEEQKPESARRAKEFRASRIPKFLGWFETILSRNPSGPTHLVGKSATYADLSLFQVMEGLHYAFPNAMKDLTGDYPKVSALHRMVAQRPNISAYLASDRRIPFNENGIFRHYTELDPVD